MLIDCDNFFVSCERIFQPQLKNKPVIVLSNNDGCVIARSYEAKALGVPMGAPFFKIEKAFRSAGGIALSCNHELYGSISRRVMGLIRSFFSKIEIYSIDEAFAQVDENEDFIHIALTLRNTILKQIGISVSIGIAPSKTLCKIAGELAKKKSNSKICLLNTPEEIRETLSRMEIKEIWGIGRNSVKKLNFMGIFTARELCDAPLKMLRGSFSITMEKIALELQGTACLEMEDSDYQQSLACSRTFEHEISGFENLQKIITEFVDSACLRLREQKAAARGIIVYISTNRFNPNHEQYQNSQLITLSAPSNNTAKFISAMGQGLKNIYESGLLYKRAGITLTGIEDINSPQTGLFDNPGQNLKEQKLMKAFDELNAKMGRKTLFFGIQPPRLQSYIRREHKSPRFTTDWNEIPFVS